MYFFSMTNAVDTRGRRTFYSTERDHSIAYSERVLPLFEFLNLHGLANTAYISEYLKDVYRPTGLNGVVLRMLLGDYIGTPAAQRECDRAIYNRYVYDLVERGEFALRHEGQFAHTIKPSGYFEHQYLTATITASIHLGCVAAGLTYIPGHEIIEAAGLELTRHRNVPSCPKTKLKPDQLFGIEYPDGTWRVFLVEADRGTEPGQSTSRRKSYRSNIETYKRYVEDGLYKSHLGVDTGVCVLYVFTSPAYEELFHDQLEAIHGKTGCTYILTQSVEGFIPKFKPLEPYTYLFTGAWRRHGKAARFINKSS